MISSWYILPFASENWHVMFGRTLQGACHGILYGNGFNYVVEIADAEIRAKLVSVLTFFRIAGALFVSFLGSLQVIWQTSCYICSLTCVFPFIALFKIPESPRWLILKQNFADASNSLQYYRNNENVDKELKEILEENEKLAANEGVFTQLKKLKTRNIKSMLIILSILHFIMPCSSSIIIYYLVSILNLAQISYFSSNVGASINTSFKIISAISMIFIFDKFNRRTLYITSAFICSLTMFSLGIYFYLLTVLDNDAYLQLLVLISLFGFTLSAPISYSNLMVISAELLPTSVRILGMGIFTFLYELGSFTFIYLYPFMQLYLGSYWTFWTLSVILAIIVVCVVVFIPETRGMSLEEIAETFARQENNVQKQYRESKNLE